MGLERLIESFQKYNKSKFFSEKKVSELFTLSICKRQFLTSNISSCYIENNKNEERDPCIEKLSRFVEAAFRLYLEVFQGSSVQIFRIGDDFSVYGSFCVQINE